MTSRHGFDEFFHDDDNLVGTFVFDQGNVRDSGADVHDEGSEWIFPSNPLFVLRCTMKWSAQMMSPNVVIPGHALHEKGLQRQIGDGTLVSSQERRALAVPLINRGTIAGQPRVNRSFRSSIGLHRISFVRASEETSRTVFGSLEGKREGCLLAGSTRRRPVLPSPAPPRRPAVRRPDRTGP